MWKYFFKHKKQEHLSSLNQASFTEGGREDYYNKRKNFGEQQTWLEHGPPSLLPFLPKFKKQLSK